MLDAVATLPISTAVNRGQPVIELNRTTIFVMHHRKSKPPAATPPPPPTSPVELARELMSRKDSKALAATSSAIALSICSAFSDTCDTSSGDATVQGVDTIVPTTYAAVRMAVEITKESSDLCLPLKAVVGAMSALMKNFEVSVSRSKIERVPILFLFSALANGG